MVLTLRGMKQYDIQWIRRVQPATLLTGLLVLLMAVGTAQPADPGYLRMQALPTRWDEGLPLGNGMQGALIWEKENNVRFALDRGDLWDERPMKGLNRTEFNFDWVRQQYLGNNYKKVQELFDAPYDKEPAPSKIPGAALEMVPEGWGTVQSAEVNIFKALADVKWSSGARLQAFVSAKEPYGFFRLQGVKKVPDMRLMPPAYEGAVQNSGDVVGGDDLARLGYTQGAVENYVNGYTYLQQGYGGFHYRVTVVWNVLKGGIIEGAWHIISDKEKAPGKGDTLFLRAALRRSFDFQLTQHVGWWTNFWEKSKVKLPDAAVERAWYLAQYYLGSTSRPGGPPISLQAIWTADNGRLPPWKGDFHHDLNTQMSYWPAYGANHLEEAMVFPDYLDARKEVFKDYTSRYYGKPGLNVPGVTTLAGKEMGGWIQYSLSPTVSAWLAHHYYWQWRYSGDADFLRLRAYPWFKETGLFLEKLTRHDANGKRQLPLSSSPEINDNSREAWFTENTNYDLALMRFVWQTAAGMAKQLALSNEVLRWDSLAKALPNWALTPKEELKFAPTLEYKESHRHFSHLMGIYPLGLLRYEDSAQRVIMQASLKQLDAVGPGQWTGYSYAWQAALKARARDGAGAAKALQIFSTAFCSANGFHLNGDQSGKGHSTFTYRPFTLEGNLAAAAGLQEMLLQSYDDTLRIMPAVPDSWEDISFEGLRTEGGYIVDAVREKGKIVKVTVTATQPGTVYMVRPIDRYSFEVSGAAQANARPVQRGHLVTMKMAPGTQFTLMPRAVPGR